MKEDSQKQEESELEEEIKQDELEEIVEKISEEKPSEELILEESNIDQNTFQEFLQTDSTAPSLEKVAGEQELGGRIVFTPGMDSGVQDYDKAFRYDAQAPEEGPKYQDDYSSSRQDLKEIDTTKVGRDIEQPQIREAGFVSSVEQTDSPMQETYKEAKRIDMEKVGRENPFETRTQEAERKKDYVVK